MNERDDERGMGLKHRHAWEPVTARPGLQSAHDTLRWDVAKSRILRVNRCSICDELHRDSVTECNARECHAHRICEKPYR